MVCSIFRQTLSNPGPCRITGGDIWPIRRKQLWQRAVNTTETLREFRGTISFKNKRDNFDHAVWQRVNVHSGLACFVRSALE